MRYVLKQKFWSWGDDFSIKNATGEDVFFVDGKVRDVVYLGLYTRYLVELEGGGDLVVVEQNLKTTSMDVMKSRDHRSKALS